MGSLPRTSSHEIKEHQGISSLNQTRLYEDTVSDGTLIMSQVSQVKNFGTKCLAPVLHKNWYVPHETKGRDIVDKTMCRVSASSDLTAGKDKESPIADSKIDIDSGMHRSLGCWAWDAQVHVTSCPKSR